MKTLITKEQDEHFLITSPLKDSLQAVAPPTSTGEVLVSVKNVSKKFCRSLKKSLWYGAKDILSELGLTGCRGAKQQAKLREEEFWAVNEVSFEVRRGECLGLIGHNGAGKTTLLKMLNGLIKPDVGQIKIRGQVGALIALGAGFNPLLTGRENIYINGSILGLTKNEITGKIDEIIDFAEIADFIDTPVQSYSSGMAVRLGFAVATALKPDVLILDEVLAVGDFRFRMKCLERIAQLLPTTAVLFVSHNEDQVRRICSHGLLMDHGRNIYQGNVDETFAQYHAVGSNNRVEEAAYIGKEILDFQFTQTCQATIPFRGIYQATVDVTSAVPLQDTIVRILFTDSRGTIAAEWMSANHGRFYSFDANKKCVIDIEIKELPLRVGLYQISVILANHVNKRYFSQFKHVANLRVSGNTMGAGACQL